MSRPERRGHNYKGRISAPRGAELSEAQRMFRWKRCERCGDWIPRVERADGRPWLICNACASPS